MELSYSFGVACWQLTFPEFFPLPSIFLLHFQLPRGRRQLLAEAAESPARAALHEVVVVLFFGGVGIGGAVVGRHLRRRLRAGQRGHRADQQLQRDGQVSGPRHGRATAAAAAAAESLPEHPAAAGLPPPAAAGT